MPIRDLGNIVFDTLTLCSPMTKMASIKDINMADGVYNKIFNTISNFSAEEVRGHFLEASTPRPRSSLIFSSEDEEEYHVQVKKTSDKMDVIRQVCGQTLGLGLGQIRYSSSIIISL